MSSCYLHCSIWRLSKIHPNGLSIGNTVYIEKNVLRWFCKSYVQTIMNQRKINHLNYIPWVLSFESQIMMPTLWSLAAPQITTITCGATTDDRKGNMATRDFYFKHSCRLLVVSFQVDPSMTCNCSFSRESINKVITWLPLLKQTSGYRITSWVAHELWCAPSNLISSEHHLCIYHSSLQWLHNGRDGVSNHQPHQCLLNRLFGRRSKKTSKSRVTGLCVGNSPGTGEFPA